MLNGRMRVSRAAVAVAAMVVAALVVAGCGFLSGSGPTQAALRQAGYKAVGINLQSGSDEPPDGLINLSYRSGPTGDAQADAVQAAHIVWETLDYRFGALTITRVSGGCVGTFCATSGHQLGGESYAQLQARFGPRPPALDAKSASSAVHVPTWLFIVVPVFVLVVVVAVILIVVRIRRRPPPPPPAWMGPQGPPPGWYPPRS